MTKFHLLLLPGLNGTDLLMKPLVSAFPPEVSARVISYPKDIPLGYDELVPLVQAAIPEKEPFMILGESFAGPLALKVAALKPPRLMGVILCVTFVKEPVRRVPKWANILARPFMFKKWPSPLRDWRILGPYRTPALTQLVDEALAETNPVVMAHRAREAVKVDASRLLRECPVPVACFAGRHDRLIRSHCYKTIQRIRQDVRLTLFDAPHLLLQTRPEEAAAEIMRFGNELLKKG